ncbi:MAG TPA: DHA2 family efflux MFS transporter permease subunit [Jatrophihabitans sp.]|jgi:EmrB/QacA subfamily drug resistance transporter
MTVDHDPGDRTTDRGRWLALYVLCGSMLMIVLDATIVNVALPAIRSELGFDSSSLAWVVNAYLIAFGGLLLLAGRLGDLAGRRRIFLTGLAVFTTASAACGLAVNQQLLVIARFVQGAGGALTSAVVLGMIVTMFPEPREQAKAIGVFAFVASAGGAVGLLAGGAITQAVSWHWIFFVNVPVGAAVAIAALRLVRADKGLGFAAGADVLGAALVTSALMIGVFTIVKPAAEDGWLASQTLTLGAISIALLAGFVLRQARAASPLMPLGLFRSRNLVGANLIQVIGAAGMFGTFFLGTLYLQNIKGYDAMQIGLAFLPVTVCMGTLSVRYSEKLITRFGARTTSLAGLLLMAIGLALFAIAPADASYLTQLLPTMALLGLGAGTCFPALVGLAMSGVKMEHAGLASGLVNTTAQVGGALGLAVLATLSTTRAGSLAASGHSAVDSLIGGYHLAFWIATGLIMAALAIGAVLLRPVPTSSAASIAPESELATV